MATTSQPTLPLAWPHYLSAAIFLVCSVLALRGIHIQDPIPGFRVAVTKTISTLQFEHLPLVPSYTGIEGLDLLLLNLVGAFLPGVVGIDRSFQVLQVYFLFSFVPVLSLLTVESGRRGNRWSLISLPVIYHFLYQTTGGAIIIPLWFIAYIFTSRRPGYFTAQESREIPVSFARAIVPSVILGYFIPCILLFAPIWSDVAHQQMIAFWQPCPLYVSLLVTTISTILSFSSSDVKAQDQDFKHVDAMYRFSFISSVILHLGTVAYCLFGGDPSVTLENVFDLRVQTAPLMAVNGFKYIFQLDYWIIFLCGLLWSWLGVYDLRRAGKTNVGILQSGISLVLGAAVIGPAAALAYAWRWRERVLREDGAKKRV